MGALRWSAEPEEARSEGKGARLQVPGGVEGVAHRLPPRVLGWPAGARAATLPPGALRLTLSGLLALQCKVKGC